MVESGTAEKRKKFNYSSTYQKKKIIVLKKRDVWNASPSHNTPPMFNYGNIYHFNVQSVDEMRLLTRTRHGHRYGRLGVGKGHSILDHRIGVRPKKILGKGLYIRSRNPRVHLFRIFLSCNPRHPRV